MRKRSILKRPRLSRRIAVLILLLILVVGAYAAVQLLGRTQSNSSAYIRRWFSFPESRAELITAREQIACPGAPFILPTDGLIGLLWRDPVGPYTVWNPHTGLDIFGDGDPGRVPVYAAYGGYLTRLSDWVSSVIIRHEDPLQPGRTIWTYYAHMAAQSGESYIDNDFPPGSSEIRVEQGTLLGYQGEYNGSNPRPVGLHLHFSVVLSDETGAFLNETRIANTLDPSPYLGMTVNNAALPQRPHHLRVLMIVGTC